MLSDAGVVLSLAALAAGLTGAWSPCGFSMVDTLAAGAREFGRRVLPPACATFSLGAVLGGILTFGGLALAGTALRLGGDGWATAGAASVAGVAAAAELAGVPIRPQIRRQVPEPWRRTLPLPLAMGLYGVLLGLGFTTFVLTLAVVALALICALSGDPALGLVVGVAFGAGRALPVAVLAPLAETTLGERALELMSERPQALRGLRALDGAALAACGLAIASSPAWAATRVASGASDPSVAGGALAWQGAGANGVLMRAGQRVALPGADPALGGGNLAFRVGTSVIVVRADTVAPVLTLSVPGVSKLAVSSRWLAWRRARASGGDVIAVRRLRPGARPQRIAAVGAPAQLGRPDLDGDRLVFSVASRRGAAIREVNLRTRRRTTRARSRAAQLLAPAVLGRALLYVRISRCGQKLLLRRRGRTRVLLRGRPLAPGDAGFEHGYSSQGSFRPCARPDRTHAMLWSTALSKRHAYVTLVHPAASGATRSSLLRLPRR